jgi:hypothetical protein
MELTERIRRERLGKRAIKPFTPSLFTRIAGIVKRYGLDPGFLNMLDAAAGPNSFNHSLLFGSSSKAAYSPPLFALVMETEYRIIIGIMDRVANPYLHFTNSPDEILLCNALFALNPSIEPERLRYHHFAALLERLMSPTKTENPPQ